MVYNYSFNLYQTHRGYRFLPTPEKRSAFPSQHKYHTTLEWGQGGWKTTYGQTFYEKDTELVRYHYRQIE